MSEMQREPLYRNTFELGSSRAQEWSRLRFMVSRDRTDYLTVALVEQASKGHPHLDSRIRGVQVLWHPELAYEDLRIFAIRTALLGVSQTGS